VASESSFDVVSEVNFQEIDNAVNQALKEIQTRFDFKGSKSGIEFQRQEKKIMLLADDDLKLKNLRDILETKLAKRSVSVRSLKYGSEEKSFEGTIRQPVEIIQGISHEIAKEMVAGIKGLKLKVQVSIQGEKVRVSGKSKDDLQTVIQYLKNSSPKIPLQFVNFRNN